MSTLLLVEDDQSIVSSLSDYLGNEGFKIESASGQKEAIEKLNSDQYDLALVDIQLSNGNGFEGYGKQYRDVLYDKQYDLRESINFICPVESKSV